MSPTPSGDPPGSRSGQRRLNDAEASHLVASIGWLCCAAHDCCKQRTAFTDKCFLWLVAL